MLKTTQNEAGILLLKTLVNIILTTANDFITQNVKKCHFNDLKYFFMLVASFNGLYFYLTHLYVFQDFNQHHL